MTGPTGRAYAIVGALLVFLCIAPTLTWPQFSGGSESLNVATVLEMHRGGPWVVPKLNGTPRLIKPPLTAWITASGVSNETVQALSTPVETEREHAYAKLAWGVRWPTLMSACVLLVVLYEWGRITAGPRVGLIALFAAASTLLLLRFGRSATTDVQLALWVTVCNAFLALAFFKRAHLVGFTGAGAALGLAFMSKGPPALAQTLVPALVFFILARWLIRADPASPAQPSRWRLGLFLGLVLFLLIALPWPIKVYLENPNILSAWRTEVTREGASDLPPDPWYSYLSVLGYVFPWAVLLLVGLGMCVQDVWTSLKQRRPLAHPGLFYAALMAVVPLIVMSFFKDKNERYQLPMLAPLALVIAYATAEVLRAKTPRPVVDRAVVVLQWALTLVVVVGLPFAAMSLTTVDGSPWLGRPAALSLVALGMVGVGVGIALSRRFPISFFVTGVLAMGVSQLVFMSGYARSGDGVSKLKPIADAVWRVAPDAEVFYLNPPEQNRAVPMDLNIYLNRVTPMVAGWDVVPSPRRRQVVVTFLRNPTDSIPTPPPEWQQIADQHFGNKRWIALMR